MVGPSPYFSTPAFGTGASVGSTTSQTTSTPFFGPRNSTASGEFSKQPQVQSDFRFPTSGAFGLCYGGPQPAVQPTSMGTKCPPVFGSSCGTPGQEVSTQTFGGASQPTAFPQSPLFGSSCGVSNQTFGAFPNNPAFPENWFGFVSNSGTPSEVSTQTLGASQSVLHHTAFPQGSSGFGSSGGTPCQVSTQMFGASQPTVQPTAYKQSPSGFNVIGSNGIRFDQVPGTSNQVHSTPLSTTSGFSGLPTLNWRGWDPTSINTEPRGSRISPYTSTVEGDSVGLSAGELQSLSAMNAYSNKSHEELRLEDYQLENKGTNQKNCPTSLFTLVSQQNGSSHSEQDHSKLSQASQNNSSSFALPGFQLPYHPGSNAPSPFGKSSSASQNPFHRSGSSCSISQAESGGGSRDCNCKCNQPNAFAQTNSAANPLVYVNPFVNYNTQPVVVFGFPAYVTSIHPAASASAAADSAQHFGLFMPTITSYTPQLGTQISPAAVPFGPVTNFIGFNGLNGAHSTTPTQVASPVIGFSGGSCTRSSPFGSNVVHSTATTSVSTPPIGWFAGHSCPNGSHSTVPTSDVIPFIKSTGGPSTGCFSFGSNVVHSTAQVSVASPPVGSFGCPGFTLFGADGPNGSHSTVPTSVASPGPGPLSSPVFGYSSHPRTSPNVVGASTGWSFGRVNSPGISSAAPSFSSVALGANQTTTSEPSVFRTCSNELKVKESDDTSSVPKGLELMVEKLGFNPWSLRKDTANLRDFVGGGEILPCEEADKDEDIIALAEFAVEQHNALHKEEKVEFESVVAACLEAVGGGRYHIALDTVRSTDCCLLPKRYYAVVLRKGTERRNHLTVLENWLPSKRDDFSSYSY